MALIARLPFELLSRIFAIAHFEKDTSAYFDSPHQEINPRGLHIPTVVSHVNREFRHVAITTATLWNDLQINIPFTHSDIDRITSWLERAKDCTLDIDIRDPDPYRLGPVTSEVIPGLFKLLLPCSRWRTFSFHAARSSVVWGAFSLCVGPAPQLQRFSLTWDDNYGIDDFEPVEDNSVKLFQGNAPLLKDFNLGLFDLLPQCLSVLFQLRHLELRRCDVYNPPTRDTSSCMSLLRSSPGLESLAIGGQEFPTGAFGSRHERIRLDHLKHLELSEMDTNSMTFFLDMIDLPCLHSFTFTSIDGWTGDIDGDRELPRYLSTKRYPKLRHLRIGVCDAQPTSWFQKLLEGLSAIEKLEMISGANFCIEVLADSDAEAQRQGGTTPSLLPQLRHLMVTSGNIDAIKPFLFGRRDLPGALTIVSFNIDGSDEIDLIELLEDDETLDLLRESYNVRFFKATVPANVVRVHRWSPHDHRWRTWRQRMTNVQARRAIRKAAAVHTS